MSTFCFILSTFPEFNEDYDEDTNNLGHDISTVATQNNDKRLPNGRNKVSSELKYTDYSCGKCQPYFPIICLNYL